MKPLLSNADSSALVESISFALLDALPPLYRKVRPRVVTALAHRLARPWRTHVPLAPNTLVVALRELARTLETELTEVEQKTASFVAAWNEATDEADRRALLIRCLEETVPNPRERRKDLRALKRWMGFDALRERLEGQKQRLLVQQEMVFRCLGGFFTSARNCNDDSAPLEAEAAESASLLLDAALRNVRLQNQLAALEGLTAVLALTRTALARNPEALVTLEALVQRQGASPWLQSAALDALMRCDLVIGTNTLAQRLRNPWTHPRDFLFRRQALENAAEVLPAWHEFTKNAPEEVTSVGRMMNFPPMPQIPEPMRGNSFAIIEAVVLLPEAEATELLAPLRELGPAMDTFATVPPVGIAGLHMDPPEPSPYAGQGMLLGDLPDSGIDALLGAVGPDSGTKLLSVELRHDGGAMGRGGPDHGAMDALPGEYLMFGVNIVPVPEALAPSKQWLGAMVDAMRPWDAGRYLNFSDEDEDIGVAFPPQTVERLRKAKQTYDPENLFHANHPVVSG